MTMKMLDIAMYDKKVILTRRLLLTEQFRAEWARQLATTHFLTGTKDICMRIFAEMKENGILKKENPEIPAFAYSSPITSLIHLCDREPEKETEIKQQIEAFVQHFISVYGKKAKTDGTKDDQYPV